MAAYRSLTTHKGLGLMMVFVLISVFLNCLKDRRMAVFRREDGSPSRLLTPDTDPTKKHQLLERPFMNHGENKSGADFTNIDEDGSKTEDEKYEEWRQFKQVTADGGIHAHSAIYMFGTAEGPTIDVLVAILDSYLNTTYTCLVTSMTGEVVHTGGVFSPVKMLLNVEGHQTGFVKCRLSKQHPPLKSVALSVDSLPLLPHSLKVRYPTDSQ